MATQRAYNLASTEKRPEIIEIAKTLNGVPMCEEYEKMISGMLYNPFVQAFQDVRHAARGLTADFNNVDTKAIPESKIAQVRYDLLAKLVGKAGEGCFVEPPFRVDYGCNISIGKESFINWGASILDTSIVSIGDRVMFGCNVSIITAAHDTSILSRRKQVEFGHPVFVGDDCWIGGNVIILPGVTIGEGTTIGAGSVVTRDIPPFSVAFGNPCRVKRSVQSAAEEEQDPNNPYRNLVPNIYGAGREVTD